MSRKKFILPKKVMENDDLNLPLSKSVFNDKNMQASSLIILLAEDNAVNQEVIVDMPALLGHRVDVVSSGLDALNAFKQKRYDIVFMNCRMPVMDGYEATQRIRDFEKKR